MKRFVVNPSSHDVVSRQRRVADVSQDRLTAAKADKAILKA